MAGSANWLSTAQIKVTPEQMSAKAAQVKIKINNMKTTFASLEQKINNSDHYWKGEAGNTYRKKYKEFKTITDTIVSRLEEHVRDLNTMSGVYQTTEQQVQQIIETLPDDIIS